MLTGPQSMPVFGDSTHDAGGEAAIIALPQDHRGRAVARRRRPGQDRPGVRGRRRLAGRHRRPDRRAPSGWGRRPDERPATTPASGRRATRPTATATPGKRLTAATRTSSNADGRRGAASGTDVAPRTARRRAGHHATQPRAPGARLPALRHRPQGRGQRREREVAAFFGLSTLGTCCSSSPTSRSGRPTPTATRCSSRSACRPSCSASASASRCSASASAPSTGPRR